MRLCLHGFFCVALTATTAVQPEGTTADDRHAKRDMRPQLDLFWHTQGTSPVTCLTCNTPLPGGKQAAVSFDDHDEDGTCFVQDRPRDRVTSPPGDDDPESFAAWRRFLDYLHTTLEAHAKDTRSTMAGQLLRFLDHRATDKTRGCWLGHMTARAAELTALLVAMRQDEADPCFLEWGTTERVEAFQIWTRIRDLVKCHPGSDEAAGRAMRREMPCIMLFGRPLPDRAPSPEQHEEASQSLPAAKKTSDSQN